MAVSLQSTIDGGSDSACTVQSLLQIAKQTDGAPELLETILWRRAAAMRECMSSWLRSSDKDPLLKAIHTAFTSLSTERRARILLSCEFYECYCRWLTVSGGAPDRGETPEVAEQSANLLNIVLREQALAQLSAGVDSTYLKRTHNAVVWSPMGDICAIRNNQGGWAIQVQPTIGGVIAIDADSPVARGIDLTSGILSDPSLELAPDERANIIAKLKTGLGIIDDLAPIYGIMIRNYVRRIVLRKSLTPDQVEEATTKGQLVHGSEHAPRRPGVICILNPHLHMCDVPDCVERLLHESVHNVLAAWETVNGQFTTNDNNYRPVSPWSGNPIPNSSFIHATFIYYMCHNLFLKFHRSSYGAHPDYSAGIVRSLNRFAIGFLGNKSIYEQLLPSAPLRNDIRSVLETFQAEIKSHYFETNTVNNKSR